MKASESFKLDSFLSFRSLMTTWFITNGFLIRHPSIGHNAYYIVFVLYSKITENIRMKSDYEKTRNRKFLYQHLFTQILYFPWIRGI